MGYYTNYHLDIQGIDGGVAELESVEQLEDTLSEISGYTIKIGEPTDEIKWYDHEEDVTRLSKAYPDLVFKLTGRGEGDGMYYLDYWCKFFRNGESYENRATVVLDTTFDDTKLS